MDSLLEKITLYDIIGYMLPGSICVFLVGLQPFYFSWLEHRELWKDYKGVALVFILIISYMVGVALSELAYIFVRNTKQDGKLKEIFESMNIEPYDLLEKSGWKVDRKKMNLKKCLQIMYSDIQVDSAYKRIHNYASAEVMYKNMFMALLAGEVLVLLEIPYYVWQRQNYNSVPVLLIFIINLGLICLYWRRWKRFNLKKVEYTIEWFGEKYHMGKQK